MTLEKAISRFLTSRKLKGYSDHTIRDYKDFLRRFMKYVGDINVGLIDNDILEDYAEYLFECNLSKASVGTYLRHLKAFIHYLCDNDYIKDNSLYSKISIPKSPKKVVKIYSNDEIDLIFNTIYGTPDWIRIRNCCIVAFMIDSGLRQSEVCGIHKEDIYLNSHQLKVRGKGSKERLVPFGYTTSEHLTQYLKICPSNESTMLFIGKDEKPITRNAVKLFVNKIEKKVGFELSSHKLRHNFATNYFIDQYNEKSTMDMYKLMAIMGHEDIETTKRYLHIAQGFIASKEHISHLDKIYQP